MEELAQEIEETTETFINLATQWDAWNRPSPDLAKELRANKSVQSPDPNFEAHLKDIYRKGRAEDRASPDLPSELRMMKYKNMANVQKLAAKILKEVNPELAIGLLYLQLKLIHTLVINVSPNFLLKKWVRLLMK